MGIENVEDLINDLALAFQTYEPERTSSKVNAIQEEVIDVLEKDSKLKI